MLKIITIISIFFNTIFIYLISTFIINTFFWPNNYNQGIKSPNTYNCINYKNETYITKILNTYPELKTKTRSVFIIPANKFVNNCNGKYALNMLFDKVIDANEFTDKYGDDIYGIPYVTDVAGLTYGKGN